MSKFNRNVFLFYLIRATYLPFFWLPVLYIYLTVNKGLSSTEALLLLSLQELLLIFLEIPTGVIADKISRKFSVGLGYILTALPFVFLPIVNSFAIYVLLFAIKAVGKALVSGADTSLLYDSLADIGETPKYKEIVNKSKIYMHLVSALCYFLGGVIAVTNIDLTLILPFPVMMIGAVAAFLMKEPETSRKAKEIQQSNYIKHFGSAIKLLMKNKIIWISIFIFAIVDGVGVDLKWIYTPIYQSLSLDLVTIGVVTAFFDFAKAGANAISVKFMAKDTKRNISITTGIIALCFMFSALVFNAVTVVISRVVMLIAYEILDSSIDQDIHDKLDSSTRATAMSTINMSGSLAATLVLNSFGVFKDLNIVFGIAFLGGLFVVTFIASFFLKMNKKI